MNEITTFDFKGNDIRTIMIDCEPYFVGKDVAKVLGYKDTADALKKHIDEEDKLTRQFADSGQRREMTVINESGMYSLILRSKLSEAKKFKRWVTSEVLPAIRKTGGYVVGEKDADDDELVLRVIQMLENKIAMKNKTIENQKSQIKIQEQQISESKPKVSYYDKVLQSKEAIRTKVIAGDYGMSAQKFNKKLNELHVQYKVGNTWVLYREHQGNGYTQTKTFTKETDNGYVITNTHTCWTQKGRLFLYDLLKSNEILPVIEQE